MPDARPIEAVKVDAQRGHVSLVVDGRAEGAFVDLGTVLHWWAYTPLHMSPEQAREVGSALIAWAERRREPVTA